MRSRKTNGWMWTAFGAVLFAIAAMPAHGQFDLGVVLTTLTQLNSIMSTDVGAPMQQVSTADQQMSSFQQNTMYPLEAIQIAQRQAEKYMGLINTMHSIFSEPFNSATLAQTQMLESELLSANPNYISTLGTSYTNVYGTLPATTAVSPNTRLVVDMSDAQAQDAEKKAIQLDALAAREMQISQQMMQQLETAAPGTAPMIGAQAAAWNLQAQAYTQGGEAEMLRVSTAETAFTGFEVKQSATVNQNATQTIRNLLNH